VLGLAVVAAFILLFARAAWQLARPVPPAKRIGWTEGAMGTLTVGLAIAGMR
jgi:hypothetical protein